MLVPCLQCKSPVFVSGSAVAAGDVRSTCGNCGSALVVEKGGVVRLAEPPPGPAAAPQLIVPPSFEPPSHATTMREYATADDPAPTDESTFYVARQPPVDARNFDALLGADVRAYVDEPHESPPPPLPMPPPQILPDFAPPELMQQGSGPALTPPEQTFVPAEAMHTPINMPYELPVTEEVVKAAVVEPPPPMPSPPKLAGGESRYDAPAREKPPALMFPAAHVGGMSGPAREAEQTRLAPVVRSEPVVPAPLAEPVLLTDPTPAPEVLALPHEMPEWSGETLDDAAAFVPAFVAPAHDDQAVLTGGERQRRGTYPTPASYFDTSDPLAAAEADIYAGHQVVAPTELVGDAFTAMVPPVGTEVPSDPPPPPEAQPAPVAANSDDALDPEELAVLHGNKKRGLWAAAACLVFAVGGASFAASRGYLDPLIMKVGTMVGQGGGSEQPGEVTAKADEPRAEQPSAEPPKAEPLSEGAKTEQAKAEGPKGEQAIAEGAKAEQPLAEGPKADAPKAEQPAADPASAVPAAKAALAAPALTETPAAAEPKPTGAPSKALQACYAKGNRYLNAKKVSLAIRELNKCLDIDPTYGRTYRSLGVAYMQLGRERSAILAYEKFVDHDPQHKDVAKVREIIADYYRRRKN